MFIILPFSEGEGTTIDPYTVIDKRPARGLTLLEVIISTLIVGVMTVAALNTLGAATRSGTSAANRAVALGMANDLMAEILQTSYADPQGSPVFGPETGESTGSRYAFDDVDDYHNWAEQPPRPKTYRGAYDNGTNYLRGDYVTYFGATYRCIVTTTKGNPPTSTSHWQAIAALGDNHADWRRAVVITRVVPTNPTQTTPGSTDQKVKRVRVTVQYRGTVLAEQIGLRTDTE